MTPQVPASGHTSERRNQTRIAELAASALPGARSETVIARDVRSGFRS
jgi:hypothetical protein